MLSRALITKPRKNFRYNEGSCRLSASISLYEYDDVLIGCVENKPLVVCGGGVAKEDSGYWWRLEDVIRASVGVVGESALGVTEKVMFLNGVCGVLKRFRAVSVRKREFGRRVTKLAAIGQHCDYLVPVNAYLYSKRFKFVVCDYYPMGSLCDQLTGARKLGHTELNWKQRFKIILHIARAVSFIHSQSPSRNRNMIMNVHGNLKTSNVMIDVDFSARLSNYGFAQLALEAVDIVQPNPSSPTPCEPLSQENDIYNFGIIVLDMLKGPKALESIQWSVERNEEINVKEYDFEFHFEAKDRRQVMKVYKMVLECLNRSPQARPSIENILLQLSK